MWGDHTPKNPKILIVEDDLNNHDLYRTSFENAGFEVIICQTADGDFASVVDQFQPHIISMDLMIGKNGEAADKDGFEAMTELKSDSRTQNIPIIVLSNFFQEKQMQQAKEIGAVDFLNIQGQSIQTTPDKYLEYLKSPKHYKPSNPRFRKDYL